LLLSAKVTQKRFCQLRQQKRNLQAGFALSEGWACAGGTHVYEPTESADETEGGFLKKAPCTPQKL